MESYSFLLRYLPPILIGMKTIGKKVSSIYTFCYQQEEVSMSQKWTAVILLLLTVIAPFALLPALT